MKMKLSLWLCSVTVVMATVFLGDAGAAESDISICPSVFSKLTPCLSFVQEKVEIPASDCCSNLKPIYENTPQCLCELIVAAANASTSSSASATAIPNLNITKAIQLAPLCGINAQPSRCLDLLDIPKDSPTAKIFESQSNTSSAISPSSGALASNSTGSSSKSGSSQVPFAPTPLKMFVIFLCLMILI